MIAPTVILVVGATGLDRLLTVPVYPSEDAKIRTTSYYEVGGGNAANTACAIARLTSAKAFSLPSPLQLVNIVVKLCTKIGDDHIGKQAIADLEASYVNLSSPLFMVECNTTTSVTTVIVNSTGQTRTCLHTPGTCGELTAADVHEANMAEIFCNVGHLHLDGRHTEASLVLAKEARRRKLPISIDVEKDRKVSALEELLELATIVFTNADQMNGYLNRLQHEYEIDYGRMHLKEPDISANLDELDDVDMTMLATAIRPSAFFTRWHGQAGKDVIITKGDQGSIHIKCQSVAIEEVQVSENAVARNEIRLSKEMTTNIVRMEHTFLDQIEQSQSKLFAAVYLIRTTGVLSNLNVFDTTGAGDAFIGGYLFGLMLSQKPSLCHKLAVWVAGRKLEGPGARTTLPTGAEVDQALGTTAEHVEATLDTLVSSFRRTFSADTLHVTEAWEPLDQSG
jgi:sugar/nucleoside kinase (ribokinase family)